VSRGHLGNGLPAFQLARLPPPTWSAVAAAAAAASSPTAAAAATGAGTVAT